MGFLSGFTGIPGGGAGDLGRLLTILGTGGSNILQLLGANAGYNLTRAGTQPGTIDAGQRIVPQAQESTGQQWLDDLLGINTSRPTTQWDWLNKSGDMQPWLTSALNESAQTDPRVMWNLAQQAENQRALANQRPYAERIAAMIQGSPNQYLADEVGNARTGLRTDLGELGQRTRDEYGSLRKSVQDQSNFYSAPMVRSAEKMQQVGQRLTENPNVISQSEMDAMVGSMLGSNAAQAEQAQAAAQRTAAGRNLAPGAMAGLNAQVAGNQRQADLASLGQVAELNARNKANMMGLGLEGLRGAAAGYEGAGKLAGGYNELLGQLLQAQLGGEGDIQRLLGTAIPSMASTESGLRTGQEDRLTSALSLLASFYQPENVAQFGDIMSERSLQNAMIQANAYDALANMAAQTGAQGQTMWSDAINREQATHMMNQAFQQSLATMGLSGGLGALSMGMLGLGGFGGGGGAIGGNFSGPGTFSGFDSAGLMTGSDLGSFSGFGTTDQYLPDSTGWFGRQ